MSIAVPDRQLFNRRAPSIRGRLDIDTALSRLAKAGGFRVKKVGAKSYVLVAERKKAAPTSKSRPGAAPPAPVPRPDMGDEAPPKDIVVTASKRDTLSRRFPGQWSRLDGELFAPLGVPGAEAIEARSVGFSSTHLGAGRNKLFIRGIADSSFSGPTQSPVGQYLGDMRTGYSGPDPDLRLVDMQSVEILEGPQGTLYGSGALGGIVLLKPNRPSAAQTAATVSTGVAATWHGDPGYDASAVLNLPLTSGSALRLVGYHVREGGYVDNLATDEEDINSVEVSGGRAALSAELADGWFADLTGLLQNIDGDDSQYADEKGDGLSRKSLVDQPFSSDFALTSLVIRKDHGSVRFQSTTGASWQDVDENFDASIGSRIRQLGQHSKARAVSNETRLWRPMAEGYSWLLGFSSIMQRYDVSRDVEESGLTIDLAGVENRIRETTVYGEVGAEVTPTIEITVGARYTISDISGAGQHLSPLAADRLAEEDSGRKEHKFLPSAALLARPFDGLTLYARYQQGFRPGGLSIGGDIVRLYRNDRLGTAELGFRYGQPGRRGFDLQGSATLSRWSDIQADFLDPSGLPVTDNIGDGRVWTATINGGYGLSRGIRLEAGLAWNDGKITRPTSEFAMFFEKAGEGSMRIPNIARFVARAAVDWAADLGSGRRLEANGYVRYVGSSRLGIGPRLGEEQGKYLDSGMVVRLADDRRAVTLAVTNLTDEVGNRFAFGAPIAVGVDQITPLRPRTIRLGFEQAF